MRPIARNLIATGTVQKIELGLEEIILFANDSESSNLIFSIDAPITDATKAFTLYPNEDASDYLDKCSCSILYYQSASDVVPFRIWGKPVFPTTV